MITKNSSSSGVNQPELRVPQGAELESNTSTLICGSQTLRQESLTLKLPWRPQDVRDARVISYLLRKTANREWIQPRRKKFVAINKDEKGVGALDCFDIRYGDTEFEVCLAGFLSCFGNYSKVIG